MTRYEGITSTACSCLASREVGVSHVHVQTTQGVAMKKQVGGQLSEQGYLKVLEAQDQLLVGGKGHAGMLQGG